ncbi:MAG: tetratricopeptide repeat protein [Chlamydiota bacterium]
MVKGTRSLLQILSMAMVLSAALATAFGAEPVPPGRGKKPAGPAPLAPERVELISTRNTPLPAVSPEPKLVPGTAGGKAGEADPREVFARANSLYEAGNYPGAAEEYGKLVQRGYRGGNLYYNLGNAHLKLDRKGSAILYYKKALLLLPRDQDLKSNLEYALSIVEDKLQPGPRPWFARRWDTAVGWFTLREWRIAAAAIFWGLCAALIALIYAPGARPALTRVSAVMAGLLLIAAAAAFSRAYLEGQEQAVVLAREAKIRYGPSEKDVVAFILHEGAVVELENEKGDWYQVSLPDGKAGWVEKQQCGLI